uniref:Uncharacterized protein n=1 Tax=Anopheles farauti TaxID=69004 RepID=A0A182QCC4_9DIPT
MADEPASVTPHLLLLESEMAIGPPDPQTIFGFDVTDTPFRDLENGNRGAQVASASKADYRRGNLVLVLLEHGPGNLIRGGTLIQVAALNGDHGLHGRNDRLASQLASEGCKQLPHVSALFDVKE